MCKLTGDTKLSSKRNSEIMMQCDSTRVLTKLNSTEYNTMFKTKMTTKEICRINNFFGHVTY